jgi:hypothetical protein
MSKNLAHSFSRNSSSWFNVDENNDNSEQIDFHSILQDQDIIFEMHAFYAIT